MILRNRLLIGLFTLTLVTGLGCTPETARVTPTPTVAPTTAASTTATPTRTATAAPTTAPPSATVAPPSASPVGTTSAACPALTGGSPIAGPLVAALRAAHNPGFDRLVFEFGPSTAPGVYGMPPFRIAVATSLSGPSGQPVPIDGSALIGVRFQNASTVNPSDGSRSYTGATSLKPTTTPLIKEVRLVEDFERVLLWGVGLQRLQCPTLLTLSSPVRLVLDFPTPP